MTHLTNMQNFDWGTGAPKDGESSYSAFLKVEANRQYLFAMADSLARRVNTVANLSDFSAPSTDDGTQLEDGEIVVTAGYRTANDGGGNVYRYNSSSSAVCDGVFILDGPGGSNSGADSAVSYAGSGTGRFEATNQAVVSLLQAGCYGDETNATINWFRFSAAIDVCSTIYVPPGTFIFTSTIGLDEDNLTVFGDGRASKLEQTTINSRVFTVTAASCTVENLFLQDDELSNSLATACCVAITGSGSPGDPSRIQGFAIRNCIIAGGHSGVLLLGCDDVVIENNLFVGTQTNTSTPAEIFCLGSASEVRIVGNRFLSDKGLGIYLTISALENGFYIEGNVFNAYDGAGVEKSTPTEHLYGLWVVYSTGANVDGSVLVRNNRIANTKFSGIHVGGVTTGSDRKLTIAGNYCRNNGISATSTSGGISLDGPSADILIKDNVIDAYAGGTANEAGIHIKAGTGSNVTIMGNHILGCDGDGIKVSESVDMLRIVNNYIECDDYGIYCNMSAAVPMAIANNYIVQDAQVDGIYVDNFATTEHVRIVGNTLENTGPYGDYNTNSGIEVVENQFDISNNRIDGYSAGLYFPTSFDGRNFETKGALAYGGLTNAVIKDNSFGSVTDCYVMSGTNAHAIVPVFGTHRDTAGTDYFNNAGGNDCGYVATSDAAGRIIFVAHSTPPSSGEWEQGDMFFDGAPSAGGLAMTVCVTSGSPGVWKSWGNIDS